MHAVRAYARLPIEDQHTAYLLLWDEQISSANTVPIGSVVQCAFDTRDARGGQTTTHSNTALPRSMFTTEFSSSF